MVDPEGRSRWAKPMMAQGVVPAVQTLGGSNESQRSCRMHCLHAAGLMPSRILLQRLDSERTVRGHMGWCSHGMDQPWKGKWQQ